MIDLFYIKIANPIWSFLINCLYWLFHFYKLPSALKERNIISMKAQVFAEIPGLLKKVTYTKDSWKDWTPWIITLIARDFKDDCDGSARLGKFLFKCAGYKSKIKSLRGKTGHAICVTNDHKWMVSNNELIDIKGKPILSFFNNKYDKIL